MNIDTYADTDTDTDIDDEPNFDTGSASFEIDSGSTNKKAIKKTAKQNYQIRQRLDSLNEKRFLDRELNSLSDYWDM
ncbi:hypothetical protein H4J46_11010 [Colwellia sp. MB02u-6]|uniref:hypothetical protein n=1 Tax=Colwellia sp. MB02u-6 TaxID=2759824 RepID=UPI0015F6EF02|nr:hypothetical protein [Colwellia sp. MB02u-6]MBA6328465.1 hypothetical protein [Colwellia sp. MB02u-6]